MHIFRRNSRFSAGAIALLLSVAAAQESHHPGLLWVQYHSIEFERMSDLGIDPNVDMNTGTRFNDFSRIWLGRIKCPAEARVTVEAEANNGLRLYAGGELIIDGWEKGARRKGTLQFRRDEWLDFRLEYFQDGGSGIMRLFWSWEGHPRELIPKEAFCYTQQQKDMVALWAREIEADLNPDLRADRSAVYGGTAADTLEWTRPDAPVPVHPGPHLFLGDYLISESVNVLREVMMPERDPAIPNPVLRADRDHCFQPYFTVSRSPETGRVRIWYGAWRKDHHTNRSHLAYMESEDGIAWIRPMTTCTTPEIQFGSEVLDRGSDWPDPGTRYVYGYWLEGGMRLLCSHDGLIWKRFTEGIVLSHNHDINSIWYDPVRRHYMATVSTYMLSDRWALRRRTTMGAVSDDLIHWSDPGYILYADPGEGDQGKTEFYGMSGYIARGPLVIGLVKVLRDDLTAAGVEKEAYGMGYTTLAWSYDGIHWMRDQTPFFEPDPDPAAWDHAHAWIDEQLIEGDSLWLYYGGYKQGHKMNRFEERQIGLVRTGRDRYVSWKAENPMRGRIRTVPFLINVRPEQLYVNADAAGGSVKAAVIDAMTGSEIKGLTLKDCTPLGEDAQQSPVQWGGGKRTRKKLRSLKGRTVCFEFILEGDARLYGFELK